MLRIPVYTTLGITDAVRQMTKSDLLILDESDYHLLDKVEDLPKQSCGVFAMTATDVSTVGGNEKARLDQLKFVINDSLIPPSF